MIAFILWDSFPDERLAPPNVPKGKSPVGGIRPSLERSAVALKGVIDDIERGRPGHPRRECCWPNNFNLPHWGRNLSLAAVRGGNWAHRSSPRLGCEVGVGGSSAVPRCVPPQRRRGLPG